MTLLGNKNKKALAIHIPTKLMVANALFRASESLRRGKSGFSVVRNIFDDLFFVYKHYSQTIPSEQKKQWFLDYMKSDGRKENYKKGREWQKKNKLEEEKKYGLDLRIVGAPNGQEKVD